MGLFPSLKGVRTGKMCRVRVEESAIILEGADSKEMARYVVNNRTKTGDLSELENILPFRKYTGGVTPGMKNKEIMGKEKGTEYTWVFPKRQPTEKQRRQLASRTVEIGLRTVWESFVYTFGGKYYLQSEGGPIGARVTMAAARIVMFDSSCHYRSLLEDICLWCPLLKYYVDDVRQITGRLRAGVRFSIEEKKFIE